MRSSCEPDQRGIQHQHAGGQREQEQEFDRPHHLVDHALHLAHHAADIDDGQVGEVAHQLVDQATPFPAAGGTR